MTIRRNAVYLLTLLISVLFVSCWDNFEERTYYSANISKFGFDAHDTCPDIENYVFNIDQYHGIAADSTTGLIQNLDSLPYGSVVNSLYPNVSFQSTNGNIYINDSLWEDGDSIDFSKTVVIKNTSYDGLYTKAYSIHVNVHQVDPDSMTLIRTNATLPISTNQNKIIAIQSRMLDFAPKAGGGLLLFQSTDTCKTWTSLAVTGLPNEMNLLSLCRYGSDFYVVSKNHSLYRSVDGQNWTAVSPVLSGGGAVTVLALYGELTRKYVTDPDPSALTGLLITASGDTCFSRTTDGVNWTTGSKIPAGFPLTDYAQITSSTVTNVQFITVTGGLDAQGNMSAGVWSTEDGRNWFSINDGSVSFTAAPKRTNASLFRYDGMLVCFGGVNASGEFCKDLQVSPDNGHTWKDADDKWTFYGMEKGLAGAGVYVQHIPDLVFEKDREIIWILGGQSDSGSTNAVWKGYINSMIFARR